MLKLQEAPFIVQAHVVRGAGLPCKVYPQRPANLLYVRVAPLKFTLSFKQGPEISTGGLAKEAKLMPQANYKDVPKEKNTDEYCF